MFTKKPDNLDQELPGILKIKEVLNFNDAKNNVFKLNKIKTVSLFSVDYNGFFDPASDKGLHCLLLEYYKQD